MVSQPRSALKFVLTTAILMMLSSGCSSSNNNKPSVTSAKLPVIKNSATRSRVQQFIKDSQQGTPLASQRPDSFTYVKAKAIGVNAVALPALQPNTVKPQPLITTAIQTAEVPLVKASAKVVQQKQPKALLKEQKAPKPPAKQAEVKTTKKTAKDSVQITDVGGGLTLNKSLQPNVDFWIKVFAKWDLKDFAYHDGKHLKVVYKIVEAPNSAGDRIADSDRESLKAQKARLKKELKAIETAVANKQALTKKQKKIYDQVVNAAGKSAIAGISERLRYQRGQRSRYLKGLKVEGKYIGLFKALFDAGNVPNGIAYLPHVESSFRNSVVSSANATGMWQFTKGARDIFMIKSQAIDERVDPVAAARGAVRYMQGGYKYLNSWPLSVTSYNHGIGGMRKAKKAHGDNLGKIHDLYQGKNYGFASRNFYPELIAVRYISGNRDKYFGSVRIEPPLDIAAFVLPKETKMSDLLAKWKYSRAELESLNPAILSAGWDSSIPLPKGMVVWLPKKAVGKVSGAISTRDTKKLARAMLKALPEPDL